ncbi:MAG: UbiA family prenyltransferase, partial [Desulfobacula sp.]|nr:UbiA family prenyltransferase [Desulfobacula sp.]
MKINYNFLQSVLELVKFSLCLHVAVSAVFGFVMATQSFSLEALLLGSCVLMLAWGCAALNNIQDKKYDACFTRTCKRVLVSKRLNIKFAFFIAISCITIGLSGLLFFFKGHNQGISPFLYGVFALICYNFLYTPLKKLTLFAIIPGTVSGMLPPLIGWTAAGALMMDQTIIIIMTVLGLWQMSHFFLILLKSDNTSAHNQYPDFNTIFS